MNIEPVNPATLKKAAALLMSGKLVAFATETVYGLGANATDERAVAEIFAVKGRPQFNPLIIHVADASVAKDYTVWTADAEKLAKNFWPGALTLVLLRKPDCALSLLASAGGDTVAVRMPAHPAALALIRQAGVPVAAPSANRSGRVSPTCAQHVHEELGNNIPLILDGGNCEWGIESTVIDVTGDKAILLRPGCITREAIEKVLGQEVRVPDSIAGQYLASPGLLASHYAPSLPVRLNASHVEQGEALLAFGASVPSGAGYSLNLSERGDLKEAAATLFASLRTLDKPALYKAIAVMPVPETGIGVAINDRLRRAAVR